MVGNSEKQRRYSLRIALSTLVISLLVFAVGGTVGIILAVRSRSVSVVSETIQKEVSLRIGNKLLDRFESAEFLLQEYMRLGERGLIPLEDPDALSERLAERIRYDTRYEWLASVQCDGTGGGAVRANDGSRIVLHKVRPLGEGFDLSREVVNEDGTREPLAPVFLEDADFRKSHWYAVGIQNAEPTWVKRYVRQVDGTYGWACAVSIDRGGRRVGVLGVGFGLTFLEDYLKDISVAKSGRVFLLNALTGEVRIGPSSDEVARLRPVIEDALARLPLGVKNVSVGETVSASVQHGGLRYIVAFETQRLRAGAAWINALVIPEEDVIGFANRYLAIGLSCIGLIFVIGLILAVKISKGVSSPLTVISDDLERVGGFELSPRPMPRSMIQEIAIVGDSVDRMKASLRSFGRYVPTDLVRGLLSEGQEARLGGKVKNLTLFFSDVEGFTTLSENMIPQSLVEVLGEYLHVVTRVISSCRGVIDKFVGDGIVAFFNAPHDDPDHALNACVCALGVQEALQSKRPQWKAAGSPDFRTRIGLHTDDVVVGNIGTPERFSYTVIGDGVNLAARLESLNKIYGTWILVSEKTQTVVRDDFEWRRVDRTAVKGRVAGEFVYELLGENRRVDESLLRARDQYEAALDAYFERRFEEAARGFRVAAQLRPGDRAALTLLGRAETYVAVPPPANWDGTFVQTQK